MALRLEILAIDANEPGIHGNPVAGDSRSVGRNQANSEANP